MQARRQGETKFALKNGKLDFDRDDSSSLTALHQALGTADMDLTQRLLEQAIDAVITYEEFKDLRQYNHVLAALHGIGPRDPLEGLLAVQMVAVHNQAMEFIRRAALKEQPSLGVDLNVNRATKLLRTFLVQMEALNRHRGKGDRRMVVEHLHVHKGAQAIVGPVSHQRSVDAAEEDHGQSEQ